MGKKWDYDVPGEDIWRECLRVLKPGGHLLAFAGTRTQHRMAVRIEDAGFEIRDMIAWVYGCLSEDTELLIDGRWEPYRKAIDKGHALCYDAQHETFKWETIQEFVEYDYDDTAFRIRGDHTDQIVSRNHRCLVERGGGYVFAIAETLEREAIVPVLENVQNLLKALPVPHEGTGGTEPVLRSGVHTEAEAREVAFVGAEGTSDYLPDLREGEVEARCVAAEGKDPVLFAGVQRQGARQRTGEALEQGTGGMDCGQHRVLQGQDDRGGEPGVEGRSDLLPQTRKLQADQVCQVSCGIFADGTERRVCHGTSTDCSSGDGAMLEAHGSGASCESRPTGQPTGKSGTVLKQSGAQAVRGAGYTRSDLAQVEPFPYKGKVWCIRVPSGAFVARRNGKVFITGNSGFPKSLNVSKAIESNITNGKSNSRSLRATEQAGDGEPYTLRGKNNGIMGETRDYDRKRFTPATPEAQRWQGWGTALKPAMEPITVARKPLVGTVAENVLAHGTGGLNIDGCRVGVGDDRVGGGLAKERFGINGMPQTSRPVGGRWPANLIHDGSDEVLEVFPDNKGAFAPVKSGQKGFGGVIYGKYEQAGDDGKTFYGDGLASASRFFYCAKASRAERNAGLEGMEEKVGGGMKGTEDQTLLTGSGNIRNNKMQNHHPTVKPIELMRYLCRLVTPPGGIVLDPFAGSGSTGKACAVEGFRFIGIEREAEYCEIARARIAAEGRAVQYLQHQNNRFRQGLKCTASQKDTQ
jgi:site-specific DNA-methyltransferase (adenine-specific)